MPTPILVTNPVLAVGGVHVDGAPGKGCPCRERVAVAGSLFGIAFPLGARKMDDAAGDLKQALPNVCDSVQIHVEVHQKSSRSLIRALLAGTCACFLSASFCAPARTCSTQLCLLCALPGVSTPVSLPKIEQIHFSQFHVIQSQNQVGGQCSGFASVYPCLIYVGAHNCTQYLQSQQMETVAFPNMCSLGSAA